MFILKFIKNNWKFFLVIASLIFIGLRGIKIDIDNSSQADSRSYSVSDSAAYALNFTWINSQGKQEVSIPNYTWQTIQLSRCEKKTLIWCTKYTEIDYKSYDLLYPYWYSFHDDKNIYIRMLVKKQSN